MKNYIFLFLKGLAMGAVNKIPGVSGGTVAFITGIYEDLINSIKISKLKKMIRDSINEKIKPNPFKMKSSGLSIPRSLFLDRLLRFIYD